MTATEKFAFDQPILGRLIAPCNECVKSTRHKKEKSIPTKGIQPLGPRARWFSDSTAAGWVQVGKSGGQ